MPDMILQRLLELRTRFKALPKDAERMDDIAAQFVGQADGCRFCDRRVTDQTAFDFSSSQPVTADFDHVVDTPDDPYVTVFVFARGISGQVKAREPFPVLFLIAFRIAIYRA